MSNKSFQLSSVGSKTDSSNEGKSEIRSIKDLIDQVSGKNLPITDFDQESGFAESVNFPFFAIVGQYEMKLALTLSLINPNIGGVLIIGPRGIGKTTAIRGLIDLLPQINVSHCYYGCTEEDVDQFGIDSICPNCAKKVANNIPLSEKENVHLVELPLNANLDDVIGGLDKRQLIHQKMKIKRGILAMADKNILYIDEINLLNNEIVNAILDAASMGKYTIRRGPISATYQSRFTLIGSMNPEEGILRPQIFDRFGLRITTKGLSSETERYEAYQRAMNYKNNPKKYTKYFERETKIAREELEEARNLVQTVQIPEEIAENGIKLIKELNINSIRAEISLFESAKALAASDRRQVVLQDDIRVVAPMALRLRTSQFMSNFISQQEINDQIIKDKFDLFFKNNIL
ncbi:MAG: magnesium chelatase [Chloroflexi bacterium HGW-Chloroflexi-8]|nr:MAG: magnesium chelatase [Chloroflexi bacterium HGW-Chloroflexi-8]